MPAGIGHEEPHEEHHKIVVTSPKAKDVIITQQYVCQIHSQRHIDVRALEDGYLQEILVKEGQAVKQGDVMFEILPTLYKAKYDAEVAEVQLAQIELENTKKLFEQKIVSIQDVMLHEAKLAKAKAKAELAKAELNFTKVRAPFDGIVDRLHEQEGSLIKERDILTTLSDNSVMWVYFNVPEARYLEYMAALGQDQGGSANRTQAGERQQVPESRQDRRDRGQIQQPDREHRLPRGFRRTRDTRLLRHGQTGTVLIHRTLNNALVIPQRATFEILDKRYVYVVGKDEVVHQRLITIEHELEDIFVIKKGLEVNDKIVLEGVRQVHDGEKVEEYEFRKPEEALAHQKNHAE